MPNNAGQHPNCVTSCDDLAIPAYENDLFSQYKESALAVRLTETAPICYVGGLLVEPASRAAPLLVVLCTSHSPDLYDRRK